MKINQFFELFDHLPTTRIRVLVTIGLITATGVTYLLHACDVRVAETMACGVGWEPSLNWLIFLSALAGVDVTQYFAKSYTAVKQSQVDASVTNTNTRVDKRSLKSSPQLIVEDVTSTSDISELNREDELKG